ncbi:MAG: aldo/keto reductase [Candidatus Binatia bacterium]
MEYTVLGRSGFRVSVAGLGAGGPSRLGLRDDGNEQDAMRIIRQAFDLGVNLIDTAEAYGTEEVVGKAIKSLPRDRLVISTKKAVPSLKAEEARGEMRAGLEQSLRRLQTDYVDIYHLHGVEQAQYSFALEEIVPVLQAMQREGKIRAIGLTEFFGRDPQHQMLQQALPDDWFDVVMVGFNLLNQSARARVFLATREKNIGVLIMFAVRRALSQPARLNQVMEELRQKDLVAPSWCGGPEPMGFLIHEGKATSYPDAAYRYCRHEPGAHVVLTGTGNPEHLRANLDSLAKPPLPQPVLNKLQQIFARVDSITGN